MSNKVGLHVNMYVNVYVIIVIVYTCTCISLYLYIYIQQDYTDLDKLNKYCFVYMNMYLQFIYSLMNI